MASEIWKWGERNVNSCKERVSSVTFTFISHQPFITFFSCPSFKYAFFSSSLKVFQRRAPLLHSYKQHTHRGSCLCSCHRPNPQVQTKLTIYSAFFPATPQCWANFTDKKQRWRALTARTLNREPPFAFSLIQMCSLIKLFKMRSWHFNTHFQSECVYIFWWEWMGIIKLAYYHNANVFFWGSHEKSMKSQVS